MVDCTDTEISVTEVNPAFFLRKAAKLIKNDELKNIILRYSNLTTLTYRDVVILVAQTLPKYIFNDWPGVGIKPPLDIPSLQPFNNSFNMEWYYYNVNGFVSSDDGKTKKRFYMLRVLKRLGIEYPNGLENTPWIFSDVVSLFIEGGPRVLIHTCAPVFSGAIQNVPTKDAYYMINTNPLSITYNNNGTNVSNFNAFNLSNGNLISKYKGKSLDFDTIKSQDIEFDLECKCNKSILLQGPKLDGLDPSADDFTSKVSGASYMYYSWPSWILNKGYFTIDNVKYNIESVPYQLWLDHQGGTVKAPDNKLVSQFAIFAGARPLIFPGWNWFSVQFDNGTQFTGYSNKPWENNTSDNKHQLKGTWSDEKGNLSWIFGRNTIDQFWTSPDSGTPFGIKYTFDLGDKGVFELHSIMEDQRAPHEGLEQYEGGCDVYKNGTKIGVGNIECVGWPNLKQRIDFTSKTLSSPFTSSEKSILYKQLQTGTLELVVVFIIILFIFAVIFTFVFRRIFHTYLYNKKFLNNTLSIVSGILVSLLLIFLLSTIARKVLCSISQTCSVNFRAGCLTNCVS